MAHTISSSDLLSDVIIFLRDYLRDNVQDPINTKRPANEHFVMTSYPKRKVNYPIITVKGRIVNDSPLGQGSEQRLVRLSIEVRVWARDEKEKNELFGEVYNELRTNQYPSTTTDTSINLSLFDFGISSSVDVDEDGDEGVKSKVSEYRYAFIVT